MAGCALRAYGKAFPVDDFLAQSSFTACAVWHLGEKRFKPSKASENSGFNVVISEADELPDQVSDAIEFLNNYRAELVQLQQTTGLDGLVLDFGISRRDALAQFDRFPAELIALAGGLGMAIELSQYLTESE
jgi:hypothetical protein